MMFAFRFMFISICFLCPFRNPLFTYFYFSKQKQVYYEQLVLHPEEWMRKILKFLDIPWNDSVLHHEEFINKPNGVSLSKYVIVIIHSVIQSIDFT